MSAEDESTFADVFNGLTMGGRRRQRDRVEPAPQQRKETAPDVPPHVPQPQEEENAASVRAYAWTGGRVRSSCRLEIETLVSTTARAEELMHTMRSEHQSVARMCRQTRSVAEIGALLSVPLGVTRVLLDDMAGLGLVTVHTNQTTGDGQPDVDLLARVLRGLSNLRG
ncbi:DUF742 domain-containing protein [Actinophytocola oryzae]|uniref:Uncharacterized protein DUF742 n=1 Tax=Actinophytocola oryzae TaxID=502181 RepID=A0A4R7V409_9PSEU|nr:DUF742 domain-containing protein [Actinophytocola oryzae]TDV42216.1 uncharacterized protein DUF742 [Actinophytocola oryzae]